MIALTSCDEPYCCTITSAFSLVLTRDTIPPIVYRAGLYGRPV